MREVELTITFTDEDDIPRQQTHCLQTPHNGTPAGEHRVAHHLFAELRVAMRDLSEPKHNAVARSWLDFPKRSIDISNYFNVRNSQSLWLELSNLVMDIEHSLDIAQAFRQLEPAQEPPFEDDDAINDLYFLHDRKMAALDRAVYELIKVQDLVNRMLHESLGGDLVDTSKPDWERTQLTRSNVEIGLQVKSAGGAITKSEFDAISDALKFLRARRTAKLP